MCKKGNMLHCWWECKLVMPLWRTVFRLLKKTKNRASSPAIPLLDMHPKKTIIEKDTSSSMFTEEIYLQ